MRTFPFARSVRAGGFTQVELVMVLVVLVILAGMAVPSLAGLEGSRRDAAAARIRSVLIHAQTWALDIGTTTWASVDPASDRIEAFVEDRSNPGKANRLPLTDPLSLGALSLQLGGGGIGIDAVDFGGTAEVTFDPEGVPRDANGTLLTTDGVIDVAGEIIRVTKNTGLVTID